MCPGKTHDGIVLPSRAVYDYLMVDMIGLGCTSVIQSYILCTCDDFDGPVILVEYADFIDLVSATTCLTWWKSCLDRFLFRLQDRHVTGVHIPRARF